jgi:NAD(P)-dependent dehydrogenase (short-subunit alcohol dehydrogenase family)
MQGKVVMVTGATNGIGEVAALELARQGAQVVVVSRSPERCQATVRQIKEKTGNPHVDYIAADLSSIADMRRTARDFLARYERLDVLLNNAGGVFNTYQRSLDGYEMTIALNHLSYFVLTQELLDVLKRTAAQTGDGRVINVSSDAHKAINKLDIDRLPTTQQAGFVAYGSSKLMNVLFTYELANRLQGTNITANALHPGFVRTGFGKNNGGIITMIFSALQIFALTPEQGAATSLHLATSPTVKGITGKYWAKEKAVQSNAYSYDKAAQQRLWQVSEQMVAGKG